MNFADDKILGSWLGLAIGDAMGAAVRGMKPATVVQCFKTMDDYKNVRPFIGKGIKQYHMKGLYGAQTQTALAACDVLLLHKRIDPEAFFTRLFELKKTGPALYFGVFRRPETSLRKALELSVESINLLKVDPRHATATFLTVSVPVALYYRSRTQPIVKNVTEAGRTLNCPMLELVGMVMMGWLTDRFLQVTIEPDKELDFERISTILQEAVRFSQEAEEALEQTPFNLDDGGSRTISKALSNTFRWVADHNYQNIEWNDLLAGVCENASEQLGYPISHAAQGSVLTLLPTAVLMTLRGKDFAPAITRALHLGGEGDKLGAITGALAGALYGFERIPENWRRNLVNSKEMQIRGKALINRKNSLRLKNLFEMESGLTFKEADERKRFLFREPKKKSHSIAKPELLFQAIDTPFPEREDREGRRKYEREKSRKKRDRRKKPDS